MFSSSGHQQYLTKEPIIMARSGCHLTNCPRVRQKLKWEKKGYRKVSYRKRNKMKVKVKSTENNKKKAKVATSECIHAHCALPQPGQVASQCG